MADVSNADYITSGKALVGGYFYAALKSSVTTIPTDATTELGSEFVNIGCVSSDGLSEALENDSTDVTDATGNVQATLDSSSKTTFKFTLISATLMAALKQAFGEENVTGTDGADVTVKHGDPSAWKSYVYVYESVTKDGRIDRQVIVDGRAISRGDIKKAPGEVTSYELTVHARPDSSGYTSYEYFAKVI